MPSPEDSSAVDSLKRSNWAGWRGSACGNALFERLAGRRIKEIGRLREIRDIRENVGVLFYCLVNEDPASKVMITVKKMRKRT